MRSGKQSSGFLFWGIWGRAEIINSEPRSSTLLLLQINIWPRWMFFFLYLFTCVPERSSPSWIHLLLLISGGGVEALRNSVCGTKIKSNVSKDGAASLEITLLSVCSVAEWEALSLQRAHSRRCSYVKKEKKGEPRRFLSKRPPTLQRHHSLGEGLFPRKRLQILHTCRFLILPDVEIIQFVCLTLLMNFKVGVKKKKKMFPSSLSVSHPAGIFPEWRPSCAALSS